MVKNLNRITFSQYRDLVWEREQMLPVEESVAIVHIATEEDMYAIEVLEGSLDSIQETQDVVLDSYQKTMSIQDRLIDTCRILLCGVEHFNATDSIVSIFDYQAKVLLSIPDPVILITKSGQYTSELSIVAADKIEISKCSPELAIKFKRFSRTRYPYKFPDTKALLFRDAGLLGVDENLVQIESRIRDAAICIRQWGTEVQDDFANELHHSVFRLLKVARLGKELAPFQPLLFLKEGYLVGIEVFEQQSLSLTLTPYLSYMEENIEKLINRDDLSTYNYSYFMLLNQTRGAAILTATPCEIKVKNGGLSKTSIDPIKQLFFDLAQILSDPSQSRKHPFHMYL